MCVVGLRCFAATPTTPRLTRLRLDGSCSARITVAAATVEKLEKDSMLKDQKPTPRRELPPIKVWVSEDERSEIEDKARQANLSLSAYLAAVGRNTPIRSVVDLRAVADLCKVNGDLGRVAGLLKLWLAEKRGQGARPMDVEATMNDFRKLQAEILAIMSRIARKA